MSNKRKNSGIVYSTNPDYIYNDNQESKETPAAGKQDLRIWLEKRAGKK